MLISFLLIVISMKFLPYIENLIMSKAVNMSVYIEVDNIENLGSVLGFLKREEVRIYEVELDKQQNEHVSQINSLLSIPPADALPAHRASGGTVHARWRDIHRRGLRRRRTCFIFLILRVK